MKSILAASAIMLFASWTSIALAGNSQTGSDSGTITFVGAVVESLCDTTIQQKRVDVSCNKAGLANIKTLALENTAWQKLPNSVGNVRISWLDSQHRRGTVTIHYQ